MNRRTILIIEDSEEERELLSRYLEFVGARVLEASDGSEGLRTAEDQVVDLILLDLSMPGTNGAETMERLQQRPTTAMIPVVALTAHQPEREELEAAGFCGCLEKPINPFQVVEEVERCIGRLDMPWTELDEPTAQPKPKAGLARTGAAPAASRARGQRRRRPVRSA